MHTHGAATAGGVGGGRATSPVIRVGLRLELFVDVEHAETSAICRIADFDVVVVPAEFLVGLRTGEELGTTKEVADTGKETTSHEVNGVVMREVHGRPPEPHGVEDVDWEELREQMSHKQSLQGCPSRVQGRESSENHGRGEESRSVQVDAKEPINGLQTSGISGNSVGGGCESVGVFVPRRRAGEYDLDEDGGDVHVAKSTSPNWSSSWRAPDEHADSDDDG
jgi:hypothetical protein